MPRRRAIRLFIFCRKQPEQFRERIVIAIDNPFLERNDRVVGNLNVLRADFGATLGNVAITESRLLLISSMRSLASSGCISSAARRTNNRGPAKAGLLSSWS